MSQNQQYSQPATFVGTKRVRVGEKDSKGRDKTTLTFGIQSRDGQEINTLDQLIEALLPLRGKQANLTVYIEEKQTQNGRTFPSAFVRVTEMIPREQGGGRTQFVPKSKPDVKAQAASIRAKFAGKN